MSPFSEQGVWQKEIAANDLSILNFWFQKRRDFWVHIVENEKDKNLFDTGAQLNISSEEFPSMLMRSHAYILMRKS